MIRASPPIELELRRPVVGLLVKKSTTKDEHLSWSVNMFYDFIHTLIHSFRGVY
jgi:hypothetical protein